LRISSIVAAIRRAASGDPVLSPGVTRTLMEVVARSADPLGTWARDDARAQLEKLTDRERDVARAVADGLSNGEIAKRPFMSVGTVKSHLSSALAKLGLDNRIRLALLTHTADLSA
jgi:DNA-binding NarL/FixJ family response regulator